MRKLSKHLSTLCLGIVSQLVTAQPATFESSVLNIPQGAAIVNGEPTYYNDIQLIVDIEGSYSQRSRATSSASTVLLST